MARSVASAWSRHEKATAKARKRRGMEARDDVTVFVCMSHTDWVTRYVVRGELDPGCPKCKPSP